MPRSWRSPTRRVSSRREPRRRPGRKQRRRQQARKEEQGDGWRRRRVQRPGRSAPSPAHPTLNSPPTTTMNANCPQPPANGRVHPCGCSRAAEDDAGLAVRRGRRAAGTTSSTSGRAQMAVTTTPATPGRRANTTTSSTATRAATAQADPVAQPPGPDQGGGGGHQHQGRHQLRGVKVPLVGLDQHQHQPEQPEQHGGHPHHARTRPPAPGQHRRPRGSLDHDQLPSVAGSAATPGRAARAFLPAEASPDSSRSQPDPVATVSAIEGHLPSELAGWGAPA